MKSRLPKTAAKRTSKDNMDALAFASTQTYPTEHATPQADHIDHNPVLQRYAQNDGVVQLKGWKWSKAASKWEEVDAKEPGSHVPPATMGADDGEVYDTNTGMSYRDVAEYLHYTARIANPKFVSSKQEILDLLLLQKTQEKGIGPMAGAGAKLASFLKGGVMLPSELGGSATTSADEKARPDQISVNKFGPFKSDDAAAKIGTYAALNAANGAIPVVLENSADVMGPDDEPDLHALAMRAHNSALAIIDPSNLGSNAQQAIKQIEGGEMTLHSGIPAACFVAVLMPISMSALVTPDEIQRYNIQFVGSKQQRVRYNFRTTDAVKSGMEVETSVPDYESALTAIFKANKGSMFLTHVIRMSPKTALPAKAKASAAVAHASGAAPDVNAAPSVQESPAAAAAAAAAASAAVVHAPADPQVQQQPAALSIDQVADAVVATYKPTFNVGDAKITDADTLLAMHAAQGVTNANKDAVFAALQDYVDMR